MSAKHRFPFVGSGFRRVSQCLFVTLLLLVVSAGDLCATWIVDCDAPVQSRKRGLGVNTMSAEDFLALAPGVSWYYNWAVAPLPSAPLDSAIEYLPMVWNGATSSQAALSDYLAAGNQPWRVLGLNEPNLTSQARMTPLQCAATFSGIQGITAPYNIPVVAPQMAIGSAAGSSITAFDPIQNEQVTYTYQQPFLDAFLYYCGAAQPAGMSTHSYGGYGEVTWITSTMHAAYPAQSVWLTEFDQWGATSDAAVLSMMVSSVDYCERTPWIEGYAWFMSRIDGDPYNSLLTAASGVLTPAGQAYVQMPVHDPDLYYRIPGRLQAERYVTLNDADISVTTDTDGLADMASTSTDGSVDYNLQVDVAGAFQVDLRASGGAGPISIYSGATLLGTANVTASDWATVSTTVILPAGTQTLHLVLGASGQRLNWLEFTALPPGLPVVTVSATMPRAVAGGGKIGRFTLTRSGDASTPLLIRYKLTGTAANGVDYLLLGGSRRMPPGIAGAKIDVQPLGAGAGPGVRQSVILTLLPANTYSVGTPARATVRIIGQ